jgi:hypothetical protein
MMRRMAFFVLLGAACSRPSSPESSPAPAPSPAAPTSSAPPTNPAAPVLSVAPAAESSSEPAKVADEDLKIEERETNPYSESVTLKLSIAPPVKALITWGAKTLARVAPGNMDADIQRPRGSGPLDLEIKADGYLPYHTRLYADRSDRVSVRLCRNEDAPGLFGYRRSVEKDGGEKKK